MSLSDKLTELTLDLSDKNKTVELLTRLIHEQKGRHSTEAAKFQEEMETSLSRIASNSDDTLRNLLNSNESLSQRKKALESRVEALKVHTKDAEVRKKASIESIRQDLADAKEREHRKHQQEKVDREKAWFEKRLSEIEKMTLKGIQPNIDRLMRKHKDDCDEIKCQTDVAKQKLEVQSEQELMTRLQEFQRSEQQNATNSFAQRNDLAEALVQEQNEHVARLKKLKESLMEEEDNTNKLYNMELETIAKQNEVDLNKANSSHNIQHLLRNLNKKQEQRKYELDAEVNAIDREFAEKKKSWEDSWLESSRERQSHIKEQTRKELLSWRERKVSELIRSNIVEQAKLDGQMKTQDDIQVTKAHKEELESLQLELESQLRKNNELTSKLAVANKEQDELQVTVTQLERELNTASAKVKESISRKERKQIQHHELLAETRRQMEQSLETIHGNQKEMKLENRRIKENIKEESRLHHSEKQKLHHEHERQLDELQEQACEAASELDRKVLAMKNVIREKEIYLSTAQNLLSSRYK
eukprot:scaffold2600_cov73-Cyclotella_meneghiniana.AAC.5